jgi:dipeptidyl aminopeptidase/acylaminoacyl peptidase
MGDRSLRALLEEALDGEPPIGPVVQNALRAGRRLRRRRWAARVAASVAVAAMIAVAVPVVTGLSGSGHDRPAAAGGQVPAAARQALGIGCRGDCPTQAAFSPDGKIVATASGSDCTARLWDAATGRQIGAPVKVSRRCIEDVAFSPDGKILATGSGNGYVWLWDVTTRHQIGTPIKIGRWPLAVAGVAFSPDGKILATASGNGDVRLWDVTTGRQIGPTMHVTNSEDADDVAFSPDGRILAGVVAERRHRGAGP